MQSAQNRKRIVKRFTICLALALASGAARPPCALATLSIPSNLNASDQEYLLETIGYGTSYRLIDDPFPLGGYDGIELGMSIENLPTEDISNLGNKAPSDKNTAFSRISIGKGLYNNLDLLFSFLPYNEATGLGIYGGGLRWAFFEATFLPATFSLIAHGSSTNLENQIFTQTLGSEIVTIINLSPFAFYFGGGVLYGQAQFARTITDTGSATSQVSRAVHTLFGLNIAFGDIFLATELDNYNVTTLSGKLGMRF